MSERYTHGHHGSVVTSHARRTAFDSAAFVLDHLDQSMCLLDLGCGPGSITLELADRVHTTVGVDAAEEAIAAARDRAGDRQDVTFEVGSAYELGFEDDVFDVVFAHQLLQHLGDPVSAILEARRVVKPGGFIAARDADYGTMVHDPDEPRLDQWSHLYDAVARRSGGEPNAGRRLGGWFQDAGLRDLVVTTSTWTYYEPDAVARWADLWISRLTEARLGELAIEYDMADSATLEDLADGWRSWASRPGAFFAFLHGEVIGRV